MKQNTKTIVCAFSLFLALSSCKKDAAFQSQAEHVPLNSTKLKEWYAAQTKPGQPNNSLLNIFLSAGTADWENSVYYDSESSYITPVIIAGSNNINKYIVTKSDGHGGFASGKYVYLLRKNETAPISPADVSPDFLNGKKLPAGFSGSIAEYDLLHQLKVTRNYQNGKEVSGNKNEVTFKVKEKDKNDNTSNTQQQICTDYYWAVFEDDVLISATYLFTSCVEAEGNTGGGGGNNCSQQANEDFANQGSAVNGYITAVDISNNGVIWKKAYNWKIYTAGTWALFSYERGTLEKVHYSNGDRWEFQDFQHLQIAEVGVNVGGTRSFNDLGATINITPTRMSAWVKIDFSVTSKIACWPGNPLNLAYSSNKTFYSPNSVVIVE